MLCWTQTRFLLPAWKTLKTERGAARAKRELVRELEVDPFLRSYVNLLGFTLAKSEPGLWKEYARELAPSADTAMLDSLQREWRQARDLVLAGPGRGLLPQRRWLEESIFYRAPMIHPLNLLQIDVLKKPRMSAADVELLRETVTGIAAGMLTTG